MVKLAVFGFDANEASQIKRIRSFLDTGFDVQAFTMRRQNMSAAPDFSWDNVDLGLVENQNLTGRLGAIGRAISVTQRNRPKLADADVIIARNLDLLAIAAIARARMSRPHPPLVYECLDIHSAMTRAGPVGRVFRTLERQLLKRCSAIIVSSLAFVEHYFGPVQGWDGPVILLENKLWFDTPVARPSPMPVAEAAVDAPLTLGFVGTLRCQRSFDLLLRTADLMGDRLRIKAHGVIHDHALPDFRERVANHPRIDYLGPYDYPNGLAEVYAGCDVVWSQDLWQWGTNSTWLLPNRIYEASYFGCPSIVVAGTETGRRVAQDGLGWVIKAPAPELLAELLNRLSPADIEERRRAILATPANSFRLEPDDIRAAVSGLLREGNHQ